MLTRQQLRPSAVLTLVLLLTFASAAFGQQEKSKKKNKQPKPAPTGTPLMWQDPGDIGSRDLFLGPGGEEMKPDMTSITFVREATGGWSPKFRVRDGAGKVWIAKFGSEAQPETAATRLVWAVGYPTEINYLYPCVQIQNAPAPTSKSVKRCEGNGFANVRFEARPKKYKRLENWSWDSNPFSQAKEFKALIVLMGLLNNWDLKDTNNRIVAVPAADGLFTMQYIVGDLGATFGKTGGFISRSRNVPKDYAKSGFIKGVQNGRVSFDYGGKNSGLFHDITTEQAKWIGSLLSRLSDQQLSDAFRAANYDQQQIQTLTQAVRAKINQLVNLPG